MKNKALFFLCMLFTGTKLWSAAHSRTKSAITGKNVPIDVSSWFSDIQETLDKPSLTDQDLESTLNQASYVLRCFAYQLEAGDKTKALSESITAFHALKECCSRLANSKDSTPLQQLANALTQKIEGS